MFIYTCQNANAKNANLVQHNMHTEWMFQFVDRHKNVLDNNLAGKGIKHFC